MKNRLFFIYSFIFCICPASFAVNVETDRTWYLAGEAMMVSVTADDARIAYAELCDTYGLAAGIVVGLKEGKGEGVMELPSSLHSGYYVLSVYTRHNAHVSHRLVAVVNPLYKSEDDDIEWVEITHSDSLSYSLTGKGQLFSTVDLADEKDVDVRETEGHIMKARVKNIYDGNTYRGSQIRPSISMVGKHIHYFEGKMVNDSTAVFYTYGIQGKQPLVLSAMTSTGVSLPIEMISPFAVLLPKKLPHLVFHYKRNEVEARSLDMQRHQMAIEASSNPSKGEGGLHSPSLLEGQGEASPQERLDEAPYDETVFGNKPDLTYNLDEYRQFLTIREVLIEYVNCVKNTKINGVPQLIVRREQSSYNSSLPSLVLIDGMPVINTERLLNYDARRIHYINIYGGQYTFGNSVYNGILSFITRSGRLTNYPTEPNVQYLVYEFPFVGV